eukprot:NODE_34_length_36538_cov_0.612854.p7 type:complete len:552 gc:universal NODE_34_length_36538_cov_0.612854:19874-18219(-)
MENLIDRLMRLDMSDQLDQFNSSSYNYTGDEFFVLLYQLIDIIKSSYSYPYKVLQHLLKYMPNYKILIIIHYLNINIGYPLQYEFSRKKFLNDLIKVFPNTPPAILSKFQHLTLQIISNYQILTNPALNSFYYNEMQHMKQLYLLLSKKGYILPRSTLNENDYDILIHKINDVDKKHVLLEELIRSGQGMDLVRANDLMKELVTSDSMSETIRLKVDNTKREYSRSSSKKPDSPTVKLPFTIQHLAVEHQSTVNLIVGQLIKHPSENQQMIYELIQTLPKTETRLIEYLKELVIQHMSGTFDSRLEEMIEDVSKEPQKQDLLLDLSEPEKSAQNKSTVDNLLAFDEPSAPVPASGLIDFLSEPAITSPTKKPITENLQTIQSNASFFSQEAPIDANLFQNVSISKPSGFSNSNIQPVSPNTVNPTFQPQTFQNKKSDPFDFVSLGNSNSVPLSLGAKTPLFKSNTLQIIQISNDPLKLSATISGQKSGKIEANWQFAVPNQFAMKIYPIGEMLWNTPFYIRLDISGNGSTVRLRFKILGDYNEQGEVTLAK